MKIENTNGEFSFSFNKEDNIFLFGTSLSNNEERIFYGMKTIFTNYDYPFDNNGKFQSFINKKIERSDNRELTNPAICFLEYTPKKKVFLIGSDNSYAEIIDLDKDSNEIKSFSQTELYKENKVIKGFSSLLYLHYNFLNLVTITSSNDNNNNISYFNLSLYKFEKNAFKIKHHREEEFVKGKYLSCFLSDKSQSCYIISCFYLDINNNFTISLYEDIYDNPRNYFSFKNSSIIGKGYEIEEKSIIS
jgi:hypothetical protein